MTVQTVHVDQMPRAKDKEGHQVYAIPELYEDLLITLFRDNLERANEYLDEVRPSDWNIAPETPSDFEDLLSDHPYSDEFDDRKKDESGTARPEFEDMDGKKEQLLKTAKIIESEFGVEGDKFTYNDLTKLDGIPYSDGSIKSKVATQFREHDFLKDSGDRRNGSKLWVWVKSWDQDKSQQDPVTDGGVNDYNWDEAINQMAGAHIVRDEKRDWFTKANFNAFVDIYRYIRDVKGGIDDIRDSRLYLEYQNLTGDLLEWEQDELEEKIKELKNQFQRIFNTLHSLVDIGFDRITAWAEKYGVDLHNELDRFRPHKKQDRYLQRIEAKRFAIIDTYLTPLLTYPAELTDTTKLENLEDVVDSFMMWLWQMFEDIAPHIEDEDSSEEVPIKDTVKDILDTQEKASGDDFVEWPKLVKIVQGHRSDNPRPKRILKALENLHKLGVAEGSADWRGLHLFDTADKDEQPELVVKIVYNRFDDVSFDDRKWSSEMLSQVDA